MITPVCWEDGRLVLIDQTRLPTEEVERACGSWPEVAEAIRSLVVRGAPAIGASQTNFGDMGQNTNDNVVFPFVDKGSATALTGDYHGNHVDRGFSFLARGPE